MPLSLHVAHRSRLGIAHVGLLVACFALLGGVTFLFSAPPARAVGVHSVPAHGPAVDTAKVQQYQHDVLPVLQENCLRCHGGMNHRAGYNMSTRAAALAGGHHGVAIVPGKPDDSLLIKLIGPGPYPDDIKPMPLKGKLTDADIATLRKWVADGAVMDQ